MMFILSHLSLILTMALCVICKNYKLSNVNASPAATSRHTSRRSTTRSSTTSSNKNSNSSTNRTKNLLSSMTLSDKIAQMAQIDIHLILDKSNIYTVDAEKIEKYFGQLGIGSLLITPPSDDTFFTASQYRSIAIAIQNVTTTYQKPPVLIGIDSVHGANYIKDAIFAPQQINIASTWNRTSAYQAGYLAGRDTRSAGITWIFSPILGLGIESLWPRMYETFGEDPLLVGEMGKAMVHGIQIDNSNNDGDNGGNGDDNNVNESISIEVPSRSAACAKHFVGYSAPRTGHDRSPSWIPRRHLHQYFVRPWRDVLATSTISTGSHNGSSEGAMTVMESYTEYDGVPNVANKESLHGLLRQQLQFDGVLVTDYKEVENLANWHRTAKDITEAVKLTLTEGTVDISMIPFNYDGWKDNVLRSMGIDPTTTATATAMETNKGAKKVMNKNVLAPFPSYPTKIDMKRIDESVERILNLKEKLHMFDETLIAEDINLSKVGNDDDRMMALDIAKESIILTKNNYDTLPIPMVKRNGERIKVHVTGPTANSIRYQSGGWTIQWQGSVDDDSFSYGTTVLDAANNVKGWDVTSSCGVDILGNECSGDQNTNLHLVNDADYVIVCIGEEAYTEKPGDIRDLKLPDGQIKFVTEVKKATKMGKIILVYFGGRPRLLQDMVEVSDAIVLAFLPGPDGGKAVIDLVGGKYNPSAKLPITYPKYTDKGGVPYWHAVSDMCTGNDNVLSPLPHYVYSKCEVQWPFGHGLTYTQFAHNNLQLSDTKLLLRQSNQFKATIDVTFNVHNVGGRAGSETIMLFLFVENRYVTPEEKILWYFDKIELADGEAKIVEAKLSTDHLRHIGPHDDTHMVIQPGMNVKIGIGPDVDCREQESALCSESITVMLEHDEKYDASCEVACNMWQESNCGSLYDFDLNQCWSQCTSSDHGGWGWNYVSCIESIVLDNKMDTETKCFKMTNMCRDIFRENNLDSNNTMTTDDDYVLNIAVAFVAGITGVAIMISSLLGKTQHQQNDKEVEFTPIDTRQIT